MQNGLVFFVILFYSLKKSLDFKKKLWGKKCGKVWKIAETILPLSCCPFSFSLIFGFQETVLLVNHALARGTPAIFVIFVVSRGSSSKAIVLLVRMQIRHFRHVRQKPPFFWRDKSTVYQKHRFLDPEICPKGPKIEKNQSRLKFSISIENFNPA